MPTLDADVFGAAEEVVTVTPPGAKKPAYLRYPTFSEWHDLAKSHKTYADTNDTVPSELITRTLAVCLCDDTGKKLFATPSEARVLLDGSPRRVMWIYKKAWETVLRSDDVVEDMEKN